MVDICGDNTVYVQHEPMLGTTFTNNGYQGWNQGYGSLWGEVGDLLIAGGKYDRVIWVSQGIDGQVIANFMPGGVFGYTLPLAFFTLNKLGIKPNQVTAIISMEGESDQVNGTSQAAYTASMKTWISMATGLGFKGKWLVPLESYAYGCTSSAVRAAQAAVVDNVTVFQGPDLDSIGNSTNRYAEVASAGCAVNALVHFNTTGRDNAAALLKASIYSNF